MRPISSTAPLSTAIDPISNTIDPSSNIESALAILKKIDTANPPPIFETKDVTPLPSSSIDPTEAVKDTLQTISESVQKSNEMSLDSKLSPSSDLHIPIIDMQDFYDPIKRTNFVKELRKAATTNGFFAVRNTGVDSATIKKAYAQAEHFFHQDPSFKAKSFDPSLRGQRGFVPGETAKGAGTIDKKEFYHIGKKDNLWTEQEGFKDSLSSLFSLLEEYVIPLQEAIVEAINLDSEDKLPLDFLNQTTQEGNNLLRALYYPALSKEEFFNSSGPICWGAAHTDIDYIAIIPFATEKGLQVKVGNEWLTVIVPEDSFIVNIGDMLQNLTNGLFVSAEHRILAQEPEKERFSMALFVHPTDDTPLDPIPSAIKQTGGVAYYGNGSRKEFLWARLIELNIAPGLIEEYAKTGHIERQALVNRVSPQVLELMREKNLISEEKYLELLNHVGK
jgi:isopenicillin N synthase-like dioxygenase